MTELLWVEKYRPQTIQCVAHQEGVRNMLETVLRTKNMPHCIFYGPPGTGKTSAALALCRQLFGEEYMKRRVLELNASDDRGIAVVRDKIKSWTRLVAGPVAPTYIELFSSKCIRDSKSVDWKIVILDEADMMTSDAQSALRRLMEDYAKTTRFIIICNYLSKEAQLDKLNYIAKSENMNISTKAVEKILEISNGDLRMGITLLQTSATLQSDGSSITEETINEIAAVPPIELAKEIVYSPSMQLANQVRDEVWDVNKLMRQILTVLLSADQLNDLSKAKIAATLAEAQCRLSQGANTYLQIAYVISSIESEYRQFNKA